LKVIQFGGREGTRGINGASTKEWGMAAPTLFIGSSAEGLKITRKVRQQLKEVAEITIWKDGVFGLNRGNLESLLKALAQFDFAVLVLTQDDLVESRGNPTIGPRDNVLLEAGMFLGRLGPDRTFMIYDSSKPPKIPSDLAGVSLATFNGRRVDNNFLAAVGEATDEIYDQIVRLGPLLLFTNPTPNSSVPRNVLATGFLSANFKSLLPIVHPVNTDGYWKQELATIDRTMGTWRSNLTVGVEGSSSVGRNYELFIVADPRLPANSGSKLAACPPGSAQEFIVVKRR